MKELNIELFSMLLLLF